MLYRAVGIDYCLGKVPRGRKRGRAGVSEDGLVLGHWWETSGIRTTLSSRLIGAAVVVAK